MNTRPSPTQHHGTVLPGQRKRRWIPILLIGIPACIVAAVVYFQFTSVSGLELNTSNWSIREFSFRRDPFTQRQLSGRRYSSAGRQGGWTSDSDRTYSQIDPAIRRYLVPQPDSRWDLVDIYQTPSTGEAKILVDLLGATDLAFQDFWPTWTNAHPQKAALLWPAAQTLVQLGRYTDLPDLLLLAVEAQAADDYETKVKQYVIDKLSGYADRLKADGNLDLAEQVQQVASHFETFQPVAQRQPVSADSSDTEDGSSSQAELSEDSQFEVTDDDPNEALR